MTEHLAPPLDLSECDNEFHKWLKQERHAEYNFWVPQTSSQGKENEHSWLEVIDDPFRTVLFEDIAPFLIDIKSDAARYKLLLCFLSWLGVPLDPTKRSSEATLVQSVVTFWEKLEDPGLFNFPIPTSAPLFSSLFYDSFWFNAIGKEQIQFVHESNAGKIDFIRNVFKQAQSLESFKDYFMVASLGFEAALNSKRYHDGMFIDTI